MAPVTPLEPLVRSLASYRPQAGACLSLFLDLDPSAVPTAPALASHVRSLVDEAERRIEELVPALEHDVARNARAGLAREARFLEEDLDRSGARGFALYVDPSAGERHEVVLATRVDDAAHVGPAFALAPLIGALERDRELVLAAVGRERGTIWRSRNRRSELVDDRTVEIHSRHDQGGWSQANFQRSIDRDALDHFRDVADALGREIPPGSRSLLLVSCVEEQRSAFEEMLAPHVRAALLGWTAVEAHAGVEALEREAQALLGARLRAECDELLERWRAASVDGRRSAASWEDALEAAAGGAVEAALVDGRSPEAWVCRSCGRGSLVGGECPLDGSELLREPGGALEVVVRGTLAAGGGVRRVDRLEGTDGVAALLRFPVGAAT